MSLLRDAAIKLGCTEESLFFRAAEWDETPYPPSATRARWMWQAYTGGTLPHTVENFCIQVMRGVIKEPERKNPFSRIPIR